LNTSPIRAADSGLFLGLDFGTSGARASLIELNGEQHWETSVAYQRNDWPEWRAVLFKLLASIPSAMRSRLQAIAICGTSATSLLCDAANTPLHPALLYNDSRGSRQAQAIRELAAEEHLAASSTSSLAKLLWLLEHTDTHRARWFLHQADWLALQLHGQPGISDYHNALKLGYDAKALHYPAWLSGHAVARLLPRVLEPGADIGAITPAIAARTGLPLNCRVRAGTTDSIAAFFASGARRSGQAVTSLGSTLVLKLLSTRRVESVPHGIYSHRCGDLWLAGGASNCGGKVLEDIFGRAGLNELSTHLRPGVATGLDYYPLPAPGERFPRNDPAMLPRLLPRPEDPVLYLQGLLESLARIEAQGYRLLAKLGATPVCEVYSAGGGAANDAWTEIRRRTLAVPVHAAEHSQAAYGAALLAACGSQLLYSANP
jgi:sugar (pentulose or hexulose) kinase